MRGREISGGWVVICIYIYVFGGGGYCGYVGSLSDCCIGGGRALGTGWWYVCVCVLEGLSYSI